MEEEGWGRHPEEAEEQLEESAEEITEEETKEKKMLTVNLRRR